MTIILHERIIEFAENIEHFVSRDSRVRFIAHVPPGSVQKGRQLLTAGEPTGQCIACHGADLRGDDVVLQRRLPR